jgi:hypothetical protein
MTDLLFKCYSLSVSQRISTTVLQRVIVLVFPLLVICFFGLNVVLNNRGSTPKDAVLRPWKG